MLNKYMKKVFIKIGRLFSLVRFMRESSVVELHKYTLKKANGQYRDFSFCI